MFLCMILAELYWDLSGSDLSVFGLLMRHSLQLARGQVVVGVRWAVILLNFLQGILSSQ